MTKIVLKIKTSNIEIKDIVILKKAIETAGFRLKPGRFVWVVEK